MTHTNRLDTTGRVGCNNPGKPCICHIATWEQMPEILQGYLRAMLTSDDVSKGVPRKECLELSDLDQVLVSRSYEEIVEWARRRPEVLKTESVGEMLWKARQQGLEGLSPVKIFVGTDNMVHMMDLSPS